MEFDFENEEMDALLQALGEAIEEEEKRAGILVPERIRQMATAYSALSKIAKETDSAISYELNSPHKSMGSIFLEGDAVTVTNIALFQQAISNCNNIDIYPLTNGNIRMAITYHGLVKPL